MMAEIKTRAMEKVRCAAAATMEQLVPTAQQITPDYMAYRATPLTNTFLNLIDDSQEQLRHKKRSRSIVSLIPVKGGTSASEIFMESVAGQDLRVKHLAASTADDSLAPQDSCAKCRAASTRDHEVPDSEVASTAPPCGSPGTSSDIEEDDINMEAGPQFTTVMLQNLPQTFKQLDLLEAMDSCGLKGTYNFCYVPASFRDGTCRGYAFINFTTHASAAWLLSSWQGSTRFCEKYHRKPLIAAIAGVQGQEALLAQSSMKKLQRVKNPAFRPYVVCSGYA